MPAPRVRKGKWSKERDRNKSGQWRKKRSDAGKQRKKWSPQDIWNECTTKVD